MENTILNDPRLGFVILLLLSLTDLALGRFVERSNIRYRAEFFEYESRGISRARTGAIAYFAYILLKISPAFMLLLIWAAATASGSQGPIDLYRVILGFSLSLFLIINLRHIESLMIGRLIKNRRQNLSGKISLKKGFSLGQSAVQLTTLFIILALVALMKFQPFYIGAACAPFSLIVRNLILMRS
jgi:hypothetical protein